MNLNYCGSGIIPIIKDKNNKFYFVLFKSTIRKKNSINLIEDSGGKFEGKNIKISAIRELKEESSLLFNLDNFTKKEDIKNLYKVLTNFNIEISSQNNNNEIYLSCFVYLENENGFFDLDQLKKYFKSNMLKFWKNGFNVYTENKDIIFIPIQNIKNISLTSKNNNIQDDKKVDYLVYERTIKIFNTLKEKYDIDTFIRKLLKHPIVLDNKIIEEYIDNKIISHDLYTYSK